MPATRKTRLPSTLPDVRVSQVMAGELPHLYGPGCSYTAVSCRIEDGLELFHWRGTFETLQTIPIVDDSDRVCFTFNLCAQGEAKCIFTDGVRREYDICNNYGNIQYGVGRKGVYSQHGTVDCLAVMVRPDILAGWTQTLDPEFDHMIRNGGLLQGHRSGELLSTTQMLQRALASFRDGGGGERPRHPLWLQAQCMAFVGLFLEARSSSEASALPTTSRQALLRARDSLLADLSQAPHLSDIARDVGLSMPTLSRGFRRMFGASPFALFQQERMHAARARLLSGHDPVMRVAADFGYTNASHFSEAFRRQFGILPSELKSVCSSLKSAP
ncbi:helix-turn-helix domain-containing protein [Xanthobacteraceae bacterium A53D]